MIILRHCRARSHAIIPSEVFENRALSLEALGLFCLLADGPRTYDQATARFRIERAELDALVADLGRAGLIETEGSGS